MFLLIPKILFRDEYLRQMKVKSKVLYSFLLHKVERNQKIIDLEKLKEEINTDDMTEKMILKCLNELKKFELIKFELINKELKILDFQIVQ